MKIACLLGCIGLLGLAGLAYADQDETDTLPSFESMTVSLDGRSQEFQYRLFEPAVEVSYAAWENLPACASRSWVMAYHDLYHRSYLAFIDRAVDKRAAEQFTGYIHDLPEDRRRSFFNHIRDQHIYAELQIGHYFVTLFRNVAESNNEPVLITPQYVMRQSDRYRIMVVPNMRNRTISLLSEIVAQIRDGKLKLGQS